MSTPRFAVCLTRFERLATSDQHFSIVNAVESAITVHARLRVLGHCLSITHANKMADCAQCSTGIHARAHAGSYGRSSS